MFIGQTLDQTELQGDGISLSLEEQLLALSLSESSDSDPKATVSLNGSRFRSEIFEESRESTKVRFVFQLLWVKIIAIFNMMVYVNFLEPWIN